MQAMPTLPAWQCNFYTFPSAEPICLSQLVSHIAQQIAFAYRIISNTLQPMTKHDRVLTCAPHSLIDDMEPEETYDISDHLTDTEMQNMAVRAYPRLHDPGGYSK